MNMRILHVVPSYLPATRYGGPIYSVHGLCRALAGRGLHVEVYTTNVDGPGVSPVPLEGPVDMDGVRVTYFPTAAGRRLYRSPRMRAALDRNVPGFDVVHLHSVFLWPTAAAAAAARRNRVPYVLTPRGMLVPELIRRKSRLLKSAWIALFERRNIAGAACVHMTSDVEAEDLARLGLRARRVEVIPNGIDMPPQVEAPAGAMAQAPPSGLRPPVVLSLGRINWKKGLDRLISAMAYAGDARLVIAGNDEDGETPKLRELAAEQGLAARTDFVGPVRDLKKWQTFAQADVFGLASYSENFGIAVLEAMACGLPVVVTPEVGLAATVAESGAGLVAEGDPETFGRAIASLLADPDLRRHMGAAGRKVALERFSWASVAERTEALYEQLAARPAQ